MYLKWLELIGFKSFPDRTRLQFEPGLTAVVGPNGCGKSNVSDAIRWVLGETSAKALRGSKMEDCIFNGTDNRKALGMAEVSITLVDCEAVLGVEYNEVTVTRRVFRSGEGQYFLNKTPCRLKDIQRLFMNTGIGTSSYSLMEQGRIDQILSSRPEDRREIFEEASGITKFKSDKKEAIRKLEQTEANLLRLSDVIREVKRQIGSLQRQAGKARRYKDLREELRKLDLYAARENLDRMERELQALDSELRSLNDQFAALHVEIQKIEVEETQQRTRLAATEESIGHALETRAEAQTKLDRTLDLVRANRDRIKELQILADRDSKDIAEAEAQMEKQRHAMQTLASTLDQSKLKREQTEKEWQARQNALQAIEQEIESRRAQLQNFRAESFNQENQLVHLQNQQVQLENRDRANMIRRERLIAEKSHLTHTVKTFEERQLKLSETLKMLAREVEHGQSLQEELVRQRSARVDESRELQKAQASLSSQAAACQAQIELLEKADQAAEDFPGGARLLLDESNPLNLPDRFVLGPIARLMEVPAEFHMALEAALRAWLDTIVVRQSAVALEALVRLASRKAGAVRMVALDTAVGDSPAAGGPGIPLAQQVKCPDEIRPIVAHLLSGVYVVEKLDDPSLSVRPGAVYVTRDGVALRGPGAFEFWMPDEGRSNPMTRRHHIADLKKELLATEDQVRIKNETLKALHDVGVSLEETIENTRADNEERKRTLAVRENENRIVSQEANQARDRLETVAWELHTLEEQGDGSPERQGVADNITAVRETQAVLRSQIESVSREVADLDQRRSALYNEVGELRVRFAEARQNVEHLESQREPMRLRISELESLVAGRTNGIISYQATIDQLARATGEAENQLETLQVNLQRSTASLDTLRKEREEQTAFLGDLAARLTQRRNHLDALGTSRTQLEVNLAESRMRRQNLIDHCASDYNASLDDIHVHPEPEWGEGEEKPTREKLDQLINDCRARLEAMGPVNLVAIEEYQELEERHAFLTQQQDDLVSAKQQLMDMIKKINGTTSEMFLTTFAKVNENFQDMFRQLFNGGTAKLVLADEGDVLESGIDIIARPPGKKLQTVSLLSGGERTMTAVALLFAIYLIKPSPFCVLDELDAALDESNINRFVNILKTFLAQSQFVVITHNRRTIAAAHVLYGVTMEERGVSKVMSMKFTEYEANPKMQNDQGNGAA